MLQNLQRYYHTIKHLKARQIVWQLKYRTRKIFPEKIEGKKIELQRLAFEDHRLIVSEGKFLGNNSFCFLNKEKTFEKHIDWNFMEYGKLWNYNLQYFDFLLDRNISDEHAQRLIEGFAEKLVQKKVQLEPYPVSLRLVSWLLYYSKTRYNSELFREAVSVQIAYLKRNIEHHIQANHLLENYIALFICSLYTGEESTELNNNFLKELNSQILNDGAHYECSPMYHSIILSRLLIVYSLLLKNNLQKRIAEELKTVLEKMCGWLKAFCYADGSYALFNDAAPDIAVAPEVIFNTAAAYNISAQETSLKSSGYRKKKLPFAEVVIDAGNIQPAFQPGHAHADALSFTLFALGKEWLIDPGVSTYEKNTQRELERSTAFHNTVTVGDANQSDVWGGFRVGERASVKIEKDEKNVLVASHDGYEKLFGCVHRRIFGFDDRLTIKDNIGSLKKKSAKATARFYINGMIQQQDDNLFVVDNSMYISFGKNQGIDSDRVQVPDGFNRFKQVGLLSVQFKDELRTEIWFS